MNKEKQIKNKNTTKKVLCILTSLCILISLYSKFNKNKSSKPNVFSDNSISISEDEVNDICLNLEKMLEIVISEEEKDEYLVINSIIENDEFGEYKWWFCKNVINIIKDNSYLNREKVYKLLSNVEINYEKNYKYIGDENKGRYNYFFNKIEIFTDCPSLDVTFHEVIHCIFNNLNTQKLPRFFKEGMVGLLTNEYSSISNNPFKELKTYPFEISAVKMLCELTSSDTVLKAFTLGNMDYIIEDISKITNNKEETKNAIKILGDAVDSYKNKKDYDLQKFNNNCIKVFQKCIDKKYDYSHPNSISYYYNEMLFYNCLFKKTAINNYNNDINLYGVDYKAYFSNDLKAKIKSGKFDEMKKENDVQKELFYSSY